MERVQTKNSEQEKLNKLVLKSEFTTIALFLVLVFSIIAFGMRSFAWFADSKSVSASMGEVSVRSFSFEITDYKSYKVTNIDGNNYTYNNTEVNSLPQCNPMVRELNLTPLAVVIRISYNNNNQNAVKLYAQAKTSEFEWAQENNLSNVATIKSATVTGNDTLSGSGTAQRFTTHEEGTYNYEKLTQPVEIMDIPSGEGTIYLILEYNVDAVLDITEYRLKTEPDKPSSTTYNDDIAFIVQE